MCGWVGGWVGGTERESEPSCLVMCMSRCMHDHTHPPTPTPTHPHRLLVANGAVSWSQADRQCKAQRQHLCPDKVLQQMRLCHDRDPHHRGRWVEWVGGRGSATARAHARTRTHHGLTDRRTRSQICSARGGGHVAGSGHVSRRPGAERRAAGPDHCMLLTGEGGGEGRGRKGREPSVGGRMQRVSNMVMRVKIVDIKTREKNQ